MRRRHSCIARDLGSDNFDAAPATCCQALTHMQPPCSNKKCAAVSSKEREAELAGTPPPAPNGGGHSIPVPGGSLSTVCILLAWDTLVQNTLPQNRGVEQVPLKQGGRACRRHRNSKRSLGSEATTPMAPFTVPNRTVGMRAASVSGSFITSDPRWKRFTNSPSPNSPTTWAAGSTGARTTHKIINDLKLPRLLCAARLHAHLHIIQEALMYERPGVLWRQPRCPILSECGYCGRASKAIHQESNVNPA